MSMFQLKEYAKSSDDVDREESMFVLEILGKLSIGEKHPNEMTEEERADLVRSISRLLERQLAECVGVIPATRIVEKECGHIVEAVPESPLNRPRPMVKYNISERDSEIERTMDKIYNEVSLAISRHDPKWTHGESNWMSISGGWVIKEDEDQNIMRFFWKKRHIYSVNFSEAIFAVSRCPEAEILPMLGTILEP